MRRLAYFTVAGILILASCNKAELGPVISDNPTAPTITAPVSGSSLVMTEGNKNEVFTFAWTEADFGFQAGVTYSVEFDQVGNEFKNAVVLGTTTNDTLQLRAEDMNNVMLAREFPDGVFTNIELRIRAFLIDGVDPVYSPVQSVGVNPYLVVIVYPQLQVPGAYQGWAPTDNNTVIFSKLSDKKYEGFIYFPVASNEFKYTVGTDWGENYGDDGADGTLDRNGANLKAGDIGMYKLNVNLNNLTHSFTKTDWGLIGSATPGGWDNDTNMEYDAENRLLTLTTNLVVGDIKFRANDDWAINLGDNGNNGSCEYEGANIPIAAAGNYTITLDLKGPIYRVKIKKN